MPGIPPALRTDGPADTTRTFLDKLADSRQLNEDIVKLRLAKTQLEQEVEHATTRAESLKVTLSAMERDIDSLNTSVGQIREITTDFVHGCKMEIQEVSDIHRETTRFILQITKKTEEAIENLNKVQKYQEEVHAQVLAENDAMEIRRKDMNIYRIRLEKYFKEYLPDQKFVI